MVVHDNCVQARIGGDLQWLKRGNAAIYGHDYIHALLPQRQQSRAIGAVAFFLAIRNINRQGDTNSAKIAIPPSAPSAPAVTTLVCQPMAPAISAAVAGKTIFPTSPEKL